ncbi:MAG TPA: hypothetical protein VFN25_10730 [Dokdonella sp.]|uniref:hypothetical protein n=1 Tax=Dokdonella sp. TaxID=2291710 RepID=UPI002D7E57E3|nr:hypothetical protein [Dokdonella sp.]HET9033367.1 hypothetical protein [Dokdonella sp.]
MRTLICSALFALLLAAPAYAGNLLDLSVVDRDTGNTLQTYVRDGKLYVPGAPGHRYAVRLSNRTGGRVLAVLSVDGVNAVSGETAGTNQSGYVLDAWESTEINGWRKSLNEIAQFNFTSLPNSYAALTGRPANVGVIGVAVFTERNDRWIARQRIQRAPPPAPSSRPWAKDSDSRDQAAGESFAEAEKSSANEARADAASPRSMAKRERLGTGHGDREYSQVGTTRFERASIQPAETLAIWYDSYRNLAARGIIPRRPIASRQPNPFPNSFVADPPHRHRYR